MAMVLTPAACSTFVFVTVCFARSDGTTCTDGFECSRPPPLPRRVPRPRIDPSKYLADPDRTDYKPFNIHFVLLHGLDEEMCEEMRRYINFANARLAEILKAPALGDIRLEREWDEDEDACPPPLCSPWGSTIIPGEYAKPCISPLTNLTVPDYDPVPEESTPFVQALNEANDITMVVFVDAIESGQSNLEHEAECKTNKETNAYSIPCQSDPTTDRPTHGYIGWCRRPNALTAEKAERTFLHELLHIVMHGTVVGLGSPFLQCPFTDDNHVVALVRCENITYKPVVQLWRNADESVTWRTRLLTITPNVVEAARRHFKCDKLEGAEIKARKVTEEESIESGGTVPAGTLIPEGHWSRTLFPDEILMPYIDSHMRLSELTLGLLKDLGWYEVNMDAAESIGATEPDDPDVGCRIEEQSFFEIITFWRELQRMKRENPLWLVTANMGPYCDNDYANRMDRIQMSMCYNDREPLLCMRVADPPCSVLGRYRIYDSFACDQTGIVRDHYATAMTHGITVGERSICLTIGPLRTGFAVDQHGVCVEYQCHHETREIELIWNPFNRSCIMKCPEYASNRVWMIDFTYDKECKDFLGQEIPVICPNFTNVCPPIDPLNETEQLAPVLEDKVSENNAAMGRNSTGGTVGMVLLGATIAATVTK